MSPLSLRHRIGHSRRVLAVALIAGVGLLVALHHADLMPMEHGHDGATSVEMAGAMLCFGVLAVGLALAPKIGAFSRAHRPKRSVALYRRHLALPQAPTVLPRAGPACSQVFRL